MNNPFNVLNPTIAEEISHVPGESLQEQYNNLVRAGDIVVCMKGNAAQPMCGFSANTVAILSKYQKTIKTFNILNNPDLRQAIKDFSGWPTYPQVYFKGKLLGGNDIMVEMDQNGDLRELLG